jgi:hypothetical protein
MKKVFRVWNLDTVFTNNGTGDGGHNLVKADPGDRLSEVTLKA